MMASTISTAGVPSQDLFREARLSEVIRVLQRGWARSIVPAAADPMEAYFAVGSGYSREKHIRWT